MYGCCIIYLSVGFSQIELRGGAGFARAAGLTGFSVAAGGRYLLSLTLAEGVDASFGFYGDGVKTPAYHAACEFYFSEDEFKPYVGAGIGMTRFSQTVTIPFFGTQSFSNTDFSIAPKAGVRYMLSEELGVFGEGIYRRIVTGGGANLIEAHVGISYRL